MGTALRSRVINQLGRPRASSMVASMSKVAGFGAKFLLLGPCVLWVRADLGITLNGTDVSAYADQSGAANSFAQATGASQPLWVASLQNTRSAIQFTSANSDVLLRANTNLFATGPYMVLMVARCSDSAAFKGLFGNNTGTGGVTLRKDNANNRSVVHAAVAAHDDATMPTTPEIWTVARPAATVPDLRVNGVAAALSNATTTLVDPGASAELSIGAEWTGAAHTFFADCDHYEIAAYTSALNLTARRQLELEAAGRYAL